MDNSELLKGLFRPVGGGTMGLVPPQYPPVPDTNPYWDYPQEGPPPEMFRTPPWAMPPGWGPMKPRIDPDLLRELMELGRQPNRTPWPDDVPWPETRRP